jgi:hypothetical protein
MQKIFNNILLPVKLNKRTDEAVEKAIEFANRLECNLHILYTINSSFLNGGYFRRSADITAEKKRRLMELQNEHCKSIKKGLLLFTSVKKGNAEKEAAAYALLHGIDLIYVGDDQRGLPLFSDQVNVSRLAAQSNCAVLTINSHPHFENFEKIVLPIAHSLPVNRLRVAIYMAQQFNAVIHLVTQRDSAIMEDNMVYLEKAYQLLKDNTDLPLVCSTFSGDNPSHAVINYAHSVNAGLILTNPSTKPSGRGFFSKILPGSLFAGPRVPMMVVK